MVLGYLNKKLSHFINLFNFSGNHSSPNEVGYPTSLSQASQQTSTSCQANELNSLRLVKERMEKLMESSLLVLEDINNLSRYVIVF